MEIKKLYRLPGEKEPTAVLLNDEGEEYPVFLESLHNTIMFPELLKSGYKLAGLPYDFVKDGRSIMELPVEDFDDSNQNVMQQMYDSLGTKMEMSEIAKHIDTSIARGIPTPPAEFVITTRKDFLDYLRSYEAYPREEDFLPLNYFVSPEARFTVEEYFSGQYAEYIKTINSRRTMSIKKFHGLVAWMESKGLPKTAVFTDILDFYFSWGIDGLNETFVSKKKKNSAINLAAGASDYRIDPSVASIITENPYTVYKYTYGLVDNSGKWKVSPEDASYTWRTSENDPRKFDEFCQNIKFGEHARIKLKTATTKTIVELQGSEILVEYSADTLMVTRLDATKTRTLRTTFPTLVIPSLADVNSTLPYDMVLPRNIEKLNEHCRMEALAKYIYILRKDPRHVSSYDALRASGASPEDAILYILTYAGMIATSQVVGMEAAVGEDQVAKIMPNTVRDYLNGKRPAKDPSESNKEEAYNIIESIIEGEINIDNIALGLHADAMIDLSSVYEDVKVINKILGISLANIYDIINARPEGAVSVNFEGNGIKFVMDISTISFAVEGLAKDIKMYQMKSAHNAIRFYEVTQVAREVCAPSELGVIPEARPIAAEYFYVNCGTNKEGVFVNNILQKIMEELMDEVSISPNASIGFINKYAQLKRTFAMQAWFEIYHKGYYTLPKDLGSKRKDVDRQMIMDIHMKTHTAIDSLAALSRASVLHTYIGNPDNPNATTFCLHCVNAFVGDTFVIPKAQDATIHEAPFYALWYRWGAEQLAKLSDYGVITTMHQPWETRYADEMGIKPFDDAYSNLNAPQSLLTYYNHANAEVQEWPNTAVFKTATNPVDYLYPGLNMDIEGNVIEDEIESLPVPRTGVPAVDAKTGREIDKKTYAKNRLDVSLEDLPDTYIKPFIGFDVEAIMDCSNVVDILPPFGFNDICVLGENIVFANTKQILHYTRLKEANTPFFRQVSGRFYLLRDGAGKLWEVRL